MPLLSEAARDTFLSNQAIFTCRPAPKIAPLRVPPQGYFQVSIVVFVWLSWMMTLIVKMPDCHLALQMLGDPALRDVNSNETCLHDLEKQNATKAAALMTKAPPACLTFAHWLASQIAAFQVNQHRIMGAMRRSS